MNDITSLFSKAKYEEVIPFCDDFIKRYPKSSFGYMLKGHALNRLNRSGEAIKSYKEGFLYINRRDAANSAMMLESIGNAYFNLTELENALDFYTRALREDPERSGQFMLNIARVYLLKGALEKAGEEFIKAKEKIEITDQASRKINPENKGTIYSSAGFIAYQLGLDAEAVDYAIKFDAAKNTDASKLNLAWYMAEMGDRDKAHQKFISVNPDNCDPLELSKYYVLTDQPEQAIKAFDKSYEQQKTVMQSDTWKRHLNLKWPRDAWAKARNQAWFKRKVEAGLLLNPASRVSSSLNP